MPTEKQTQSSTRVQTQGQYAGRSDGTSNAMAHARAYFPRGLYQPDGGFRFSTDALLLAAFAAQFVHNPDTPRASNGLYRAELDGTHNAAHKLLDLGTGCGVVAFGVQILSTVELCAWGLDREPDLLNAARVNARQLGFTERFTTVRADLSNPDACRTFTQSRYDNNFPVFRPENKKQYAFAGIAKVRLPHNDRLRKPARIQAYSSARRAVLRYSYRKRFRLAFAPLKRKPHTVAVNDGASASQSMPTAYNLITANPPYRLLGSGRLPASRLRREALFGTHNTLLHFVRAALFYLAPDGTACFCIPAERAEELLCLIIDNGLLPTRRLNVRTRAHKAPYLCLIAACRLSSNERPPRKAPDSYTMCALLTSDLVLMEPDRLSGVATRNKETSKGSGMRYTTQALAFCPFLSAGHEPSGM